jgi:hypothetical protein
VALTEGSFARSNAALLCSRLSAGVLLTSIRRHIVAAWLTITAKCCIEEAFSKIEVALRNAQARTREALIEALGVAISTVTAKDARGFFEHGSYHLPVHLL